MKIALDTNAYEAFMKNDLEAAKVIRTATLIGIPVPVLAELRFGFQNGTKGKQNEGILSRFLDSSRVAVLTCDEATTHFYAALKHQLKNQGTPIPINDVWIAAIAIQHRLTLFTFDKDFNHLPQLARI